VKLEGIIQSGVRCGVVLTACQVDRKSSRSSNEKGMSTFRHKIELLSANVAVHAVMADASSGDLDVGDHSYWGGPVAH